MIIKMEDEKKDDDDDEKESSTSKLKKLKDTSHLHLGNHYADKSNIEHNSENESSACFYCSKCKKSFSSKMEAEIHECNK